VTPSFTLRSTRYGEQLQNGALLDQSLVRTTEEFSVDLRPPAFDRIWGGGDTKWKHVIEPQVVYRLVNGVNQFDRFVRFDEDETLSNTNEIEYGFTQRLFRKTGSNDAEELVSWRIAQKYYFDPTFGGAIVVGERNVLQALDSITPFAFADTTRSYSPVVSDLRITPGGRYDAQFRLDYDPRRGQITAAGTLLKVRPYRQSFVTLADFSAVNLKTPSSPPNLAPRSNQVRALIGYGDLNRRGWNTAFGFSYDVTQHFFQNQVAQISYNGSCCGLGFEFRRLSLGTVRVENQYRIVLLIANIGSVGNLRRQERVF
jgi:LPS-assembly protein